MFKKKFIKAINLTIAAGVLFLSTRYIIGISHEISFGQIFKQLQGADQGRTAVAFILTATNYLLVIGYDLLTAAQLRLNIPRRHLGMISLISFIFTNNLGFGALMGGLLRFRFFSRFNISPLTIGNYMVLFSWIYWLGLLVLAAVVFLIPAPGWGWSLPFGSIEIKGYFLGFAALALLCIFVFLVMIKRHYHLKSKLLYPLARPRIALAQIAISTFDWLLLASVFFLLLPEKCIALLPYLPIFMLAQIGSVISHLPAGIGAYDSMIIFYFKPIIGSNAIISSLIMFRVLYFLVPLGIGIGLLFIYELYFATSIRKESTFLRHLT